MFGLVLKYTITMYTKATQKHTKKSSCVKHWLLQNNERSHQSCSLWLEALCFIVQITRNSCTTVAKHIWEIKTKLTYLILQKRLISFEVWTKVPNSNDIPSAYSNALVPLWVLRNTRCSLCNTLTFLSFQNLSFISLQFWYLFKVF